MMHIEPLAHRELAVAQKIHAVLLLAHAQEAQLLQVTDFVPMARTPEDLQASEDYFLGAFLGETLLGCLGLGPDDEPGQISIASLVVHPAHQRQGIARALMAEALRRAAGMVLSVATGAKNTPALALYRSLGFAEYRRGTLGAEAIEIVKLRRVVPATPDGR
jgi:ribosomal protein S18 acetylase RimI-like enzyme